VFDFLGSTNIIPAKLSGGGLQVGGEVVARLADTTLADGPVDIYVRPGDLRATGGHQTEGLVVHIRKVHRTGPVVRVTAEVEGADLDLTVELPHLHHDVTQFQVGASLRLRLLLFSVFPRATAVVAPSAAVVTAPLLIGRERARA
jgi:sulfate/thiosulfate transport system ATP-binding protein